MFLTWSSHTLDNGHQIAVPGSMEYMYYALLIKHTINLRYLLKTSNKYQERILLTGSSDMCGVRLHSQISTSILERDDIVQGTCDLLWRNKEQVASYI